MIPEPTPPPYEHSNTNFREPADGNLIQSLPLQRDITHERGSLRRSGSPAKEKIHLDFTQRFERKLAEYNGSENVFKRWLFEIMCWLISAISMGAIVAIYIWLQNRPLTEAGNCLTYTNVLGKIASAALIVPTSEALGQLKWNWFQKSNAMWDFEIFDKASRGPLGAALLLFRTKGRSLAALGALLIVLLLAIDTFFQQVVDLPERRILQAGSSIPRVISYRPEYLPEYFQGYETQLQDAFIYPTIRSFFYGNGTQPVAFGNGTRPDIPLTCPTSTCTWPEYETLGLCSQCTDASNLLEYRCAYTKIDWTTSYTGYVNEQSGPNGTVCGYFYDVEGRRPVLMSGYIVNETEELQTPGEALLVRTFSFTEVTKKRPISGGSINFKHVRNPLLDALIVSSASANDVYLKKPPVAQECILSWCVRTIESTYESGHYSEQVKSTYQNMTTGWFPWESTELPVIDGVPSYWVIYNQSIVIDRHVSAPNASDSVIFDDVYTVDNVTVSNMQIIFDSIFPSYLTEHGPSGKPMMRYKEFWNGASFRELPFSPWQAPNNVTRHLERMATAMTNTMRSLPGMTMLDGAAYSKQVFVSIRWAWLAFPIILLVLSLVFLVATIIKTSTPGAAAIWKTSAMPALIYSLPKETQGQFDNWGKGTGAPRKTRIKLLPNMGWRVSGHSYASRSPRLASGERVPRGWI